MNKRQVALRNLFISSPITAAIVIDNDQVIVENISDQRYGIDDILKGYIKQLLDMDHWQHTGHMDLEKIFYRDTKEYHWVLEILKEKIQKRKDDIQKLKDGIKIIENQGNGEKL
jgi:hypothetical protein